MSTNRKALLLLSVPFAVVSIATLLLYFLADQTLDALHKSMHFSDVWMEADRNALAQVSRCLEAGGNECNLVESQLKRPLAYIRATQERAKPHPDPKVIQEALSESGIDASPARFRMRWFERVSQMAGIGLRNLEISSNRDAREQGKLPSDLQGILDLNRRAKMVRSAQTPDKKTITELSDKVHAFSASLERAKTKFDAQAVVATRRLRDILYALFATSVVTLFGLALWLFQRMLKSWHRQETALLNREKQLSRDLSHSVEQLQAALADRTILLQEVQHRVKNNLAVISALLNLEADRSKDSRAELVLANVRDRVRSMAFVHDRLTYDGTIAELDAGDYVDALAQHLFKSLAGIDQDIQFHSKVRARLLIDQAIPCGLIINELLTNSLKHAFVGKRAGNVWLDLTQSGDEVQLGYRDDGAGLPAAFNLETADSLGMQLITDLSSQLGGKAEWGGSSGVTFRLTFACHNSRNKAKAKTAQG